MPADTGRERVRTYPTRVRESPYFEFALAEGLVSAVPYNRMWLPVDFGRDPREEYEALLRRVTLWDVGCERALEVRGPDAVRFTDHLLTRDIANQPIGRCRHATACTEDGVILCEALVIRLSDERVWICHGPADFPSWAQGIAMHSGHDVEILEAPVSPLALQGAKALDVMRELAPVVAELPRFGWAWTTIAGEEVLVSRTGWSGEFGYEVFAEDDDPAKRVWREVRQAAEPHGVLVTPVTSDRAWEHGITDITYGDNLDLNPFEVGLERAVDLGKSAGFVGDRALRRIADTGRHRTAITFALEAAEVPELDAFWPVVDAESGSALGFTWHVLYSYALERHAGDAIVDAPVAVGTEIELLSSAGRLSATVIPHPVLR